MEFLFNASAAALALFVPIAAADGVYLHLWKIRLHSRPETQREHALHTAHAFLFVPMLVLLYAGDTAGLALWAGIAAVLVNIWIVIADIREESISRRFQGGLPGLELRLHVVIIALQFLATGLSLAARPASAWLPGATASGAQVAAAQIARGLAWQGILPGAVLMAVLHVALLVWGQWRIRSSAASAASGRRPSLVAACC